jgi:hypothetical protein
MRLQVFDDFNPDELTLPEVTVTEDEAEPFCNIAIKFVFDQVPEREKIINQIKHIFNNSLLAKDVYYDDVPFIVWIKSTDGLSRERACANTAENLMKVLKGMTNGQIHVYVYSDSKPLNKVLEGSNLKDLQIVMVGAGLNANKFANAL